MMLCDVYNTVDVWVRTVPGYGQSHCRRFSDGIVSLPFTNAPDIDDTLSWLTMICSYAAQMSVTPVQQVMENMSLSQSISLYGLQWHILNPDTQNQPVPPPGGNAEKMLTRAYELGAAFLAER